MGARALAAAVIRRWYVTLLGAVLTLVCVFVAFQAPGVYWVRVTLVVLGPPTLSAPNVLTEKSPSAIAAVAVMDATHAPLSVHAASSQATLYGLGVTRGTLIRLQNTGSQWVPTAGQAYVDVEAVDSSPQATEERVTSAVGRVREAMLRRQIELRVRPKNRTYFEAIPPQASAQWIPPSPTRALAGYGLVGVLLSVSATVLIDRVMLGRRTHLGSHSGGVT